MTGVLRAFRGRGIAAALKRTQIALGEAGGLREAADANEVRNEPIRRLNERHGYELQPGLVDAARRRCPGRTSPSPA